MSGASHTPGPWQVAGCRHSGDLKIGADTRLHAVGPDGDAVAMVFFDMKTGRGLADARLIAAAPDLLAALKGLLSEVNGFHAATIRDERAADDESLGAARAAIAKATSPGEPS